MACSNFCRRSDLQQIRLSKSTVGSSHQHERASRESPGTRGANFEHVLRDTIFREQNRVTVDPLHNQHLADTRIDPEGHGLTQTRTCDFFLAEDGSLWDAKAYGKGSRIDLEQLRDYNLLVDATDQGKEPENSQGQRIKVRYINYIFSDLVAANANADRIGNDAVIWYLSKDGQIVPINASESSGGSRSHG